MALAILESMGDETSHLSLFQGAPWLGWCQQGLSPFPHTQAGIEETLRRPLKLLISNLTTSFAQPRRCQQRTVCGAMLTSLSWHWDDQRSGELPQGETDFYMVS